jgi:hypothetical protein
MDGLIYRLRQRVGEARVIEPRVSLLARELIHVHQPPPTFMQIYLILMIVAIVVGTLVDKLHQGSTKI